jgi:cell division protein FtsI/penicillin-binding protein 2
MIAAAFVMMSGLFDQAIARVLADRVDGSESSYLLMRVDTREIVSSRWPDVDVPIAPGSLLKPFLATAINPQTIHTCKAQECWLPHGHGQVALREAIAQSCNSYFLQELRSRGAQPAMHAAGQYGLPLPADTSASTLIGLGTGWKASPVEIASGYARLARAESALVVREGMRLAAETGTARHAGPLALVKTGTAACFHDGGGPGDGLVVALYPAAKPEYVLILRVHGTTGAVAARTAGDVIRVLHAHR